MDIKLQQNSNKKFKHCTAECICFCQMNLFSHKLPGILTIKMQTNLDSMNALIGCVRLESNALKIIFGNRGYAIKQHEWITYS